MTITMHFDLCRNNIFISKFLRRKIPSKTLRWAICEKRVLQGLAQSAEDQIPSQVKEIVSAQNLALGTSSEKRLHCNCIGIANQMGKEGKFTERP